MNTSRKLLLAGVAVVATTAAASSALAQASATTSATASATIFQPITVTKATDLAFGRLIRPSTGNTTVYTVSETNGATSVSGGDGIFTSGGGTPGRATFTVGGEGGQGFAISSDSTVVANGITINLVKSAGTGSLSGTLGSSGSATFGVGGNITLTDTSPTGLASGSFNVTVSYN
jgi:hypothetical protein